MIFNFNSFVFTFVKFYSVTIFSVEMASLISYLIIKLTIYILYFHKKLIYIYNLNKKISKINQF